MLGPLAVSGGSTPTHALLPGSPAIDWIPVAQCAVTADQRGVVRPQPSWGGCDIGAYEALARPDIAPMIESVKRLQSDGILTKTQELELLRLLKAALLAVATGDDQALPRA